MCLLAAIGACGGSALTLWAEPPQPAQGAQAAPPITVRAQPPVTIGGQTPDQGPCVAVDVAGNEAGTTDCAAQKLQDAARAAQHAAGADPTLSVPNARSGDTTVGIGSLTGSSQRLGADLRGRTSLPQRPVPPTATTPFPRRP